MNKRDYEALIKRSKNRLLYAIYRESQKTLKNMVKYPYGEQENNLDEILYVLLLLIYNYAAWEVLDVTKLIELVRLYPILDPIVLKRIKRALKYDKGLLKSIYKDKIDRLSNFEVHQIFADMPDELKYYLSKVTSKVIFDAQKVIAAKQIDTENIESELKKFFHNRAKVVAETESVRYFNLGLLRASYFGNIVAFRYKAIMDEKTCPMCAARNGRIILANDFAGMLENTPPLHPNCYTEGHKLFTLEGWKDFDEVDEGEWVWSMNPQTLELEPARVTCKIKYWHDGFVYHIYNKWFDMQVTPEHSMWVLTKYRKTLREVKPSELLGHMQIPRVVKWQGVEPETITFAGLEFNTEDFVKFMAWYLSDGSVSVLTKWKRAKNKERAIKYEIKITQEDERYQKYIFELARRLFEKYGNVWLGKTAIWIRGKQLDGLAEELKNLGHSYEKYVPSVIKQLSPKMLRVFLEEYSKGDGHKRKPKPYKGGNFKPEITLMTSSRRLANDLAEIIIKAGWQFSWSEPTGFGQKIKFKNGEYAIKHPVYKLAIKRSKTACVRGLNIEQVEYHGYAYDVELDRNHVLLVMYNGKIAWSGNCRCYLEPLNKLPSSFKLINEVESPALKRDIDKMLIGSVLR